MKRNHIFAFVLMIGIGMMTLPKLSAQNQENDGSSRLKSGFEIGLGGSLYLKSSSRAGVVGDLKWLLPTRSERGSGLVITAKMIHYPPTNTSSKGGLFDEDKKNYKNNVSGDFLMVGYRIYLTGKPAEENPFYLELNAGGGYTSRISPGVIFNAALGYKPSERWTIFAGGNLVKAKTKEPSGIDLGIRYQFNKRK